MAEWQPISTAPKDGLLLLAVESGHERRTFVAEWSTAKGGYWVMTSGWVGWGKMHPAWEPTHWMPLPAPPIGTTDGGKGDE